MELMPGSVPRICRAVPVPRCDMLRHAPKPSCASCHKITSSSDLCPFLISRNCLQALERAPTPPPIPNLPTETPNSPLPTKSPQLPLPIPNHLPPNRDPNPHSPTKSPNSHSPIPNTSLQQRPKTPLPTPQLSLPNHLPPKRPLTPHSPTASPKPPSPSRGPLQSVQTKGVTECPDKASVGDQRGPFFV
nr:extensin-like [Penaeus vannamei]